MKIEYFGHSCFRLTSSAGVRLITDPYTRVGYELPCGISADIITVTHAHFDHNYVDGISDFKEIWNIAGKQAFGEVKANAILCNHDEKGGMLRGKNLIFKIEMDGLVLCHLGDLGEKYSSALEEQIGKTDVLFLPVGGTYTIDAVQAKEYVDALKPKLVIPMHYRPNDGTIDISSAEAFLKLCKDNVKATQSKNELELSKEDLLDFATEIIYMERKI